MHPCQASWASVLGTQPLVRFQLFVCHTNLEHQQTWLSNYVDVLILMKKGLLSEMSPVLSACFLFFYNHAFPCVGSNIYPIPKMIRPKTIDGDIYSSIAITQTCCSTEKMNTYEFVFNVTPNVTSEMV